MRLYDADSNVRQSVLDRRWNMSNLHSYREFWLSIKYPVFIIGGLSYLLHVTGMSDDLLKDFGYHTFVFVWSFVVAFGISSLITAFRIKVIPCRSGLIKKRESPLAFWFMVCFFVFVTSATLVMSILIWFISSGHA